MSVSYPLASKCLVHAVIWLLNTKGVKPVKIHRQLTKVYGQSCMGAKNVHKLCRKFTAGRTRINLKDMVGMTQTFQELPKQECIDWNGDYVEKNISSTFKML